jgi:hypothetical protein
MRMRIGLLGCVLVCVARPVALAAQEGAITGTVQEADGKPAFGVSVIVPELRATAVTDIAGRFQISHIPFGDYHVVVSRLGRAPLTRTVAVRAGQSASVDFTFAAPDNPTVQIRAPGAVGAVVTVDGRVQGAAPGEFVVAPGSHRFKVSETAEPNRYCVWTATLSAGDGLCYNCDTRNRRSTGC